MTSLSLLAGRTVPVQAIVVLIVHGQLHKLIFYFQHVLIVYGGGGVLKHKQI